MNSDRMHKRPGLVLITAVVLALLTGCAGTQKAAGPRPENRYPSKTAAQLHETLHRLHDTGATVSARVIDLETGAEIYAADPDRPVIPASNMKLIVSATGLDRFGPDRAFNTYLARDGDDLWIIGTGDPGIGDPRIAKRHGKTVTAVLDEWADALAARGATEIKGDLYYYDGAFDNQTVHPSWSSGSLVHWYAAPVAGLNFNDNCVDITVFPTEPGRPVRYEVAPPVRNIRVVNHCVTGEENKPTIERKPNANEYVLGGTCSEQTALKSKPVTDPGAFFADALRTHLASRGITIRGDTRRAAEPLAGQMPPPPDNIVAVHETDITDLLWRINKNSQNLLAEALCKQTGGAYLTGKGVDAPGAWPAGQDAAKAFLRSNGIDATPLVLADGSGLSRDNRVTTALISDLLVAMADHPDAQAFRDSLAVGGRDGTIAKRLTDHPDRVFAKTGYISGVRALSGYVHTQNDRWLVFSIIYNNIPGPVKPYQDLQDEACVILIESTADERAAHAVGWASPTEP